MDGAGHHPFFLDEKAVHLPLPGYVVPHWEMKERFIYLTGVIATSLGNERVLHLP
jgi:hypothetical protein